MRIKKFEIYYGGSERAKYIHVISPSHHHCRCRNHYQSSSLSWFTCSVINLKYLHSIRSSVLFFSISFAPHIALTIADRGPDGDVGIEGTSGSDGKGKWSEMVRACVEEG